MTKEKINHQYLRIAVKKTSDALISELEAVDALILQYNALLEKAQPLFNGRVLVKFSPRSKIKIEDDYYYDKSPYIGQMFKKGKGNWVFAWTKKSARWKNLEDLRVGKGLKGDAVVVRLLRALEELLQVRNELATEIKAQRLTNGRKVQSLEYLCARKQKELEVLNQKVTVDWTKDAAKLYAKIDPALLAAPKDNY